ncbi:uncharacterized protein [Clytia hemisphaerica]|uniref:Uncharacterized protein n=1 Tax=Clytia hemisphaerica TaxID=252671 RepID=A0A7M5V2W4_9CNID
MQDQRLRIPFHRMKVEGEDTIAIRRARNVLLVTASLCLVTFITLGVCFLDVPKIVSEDETTLNTQSPVSDNRWPRRNVKHLSFLWNDHVYTQRVKDIKKVLEKKLETESEPIYLLSVTKDSSVVMMAMKAGWKRACHRHPVHLKLEVLEGEMYFKSHEMKNTIHMKPGDEMVIPKWQPHYEGVQGRRTVFVIITLSPNCPPDKIVEMLNADECDSEKNPPLTFPPIHEMDQPVDNQLPDTWSATIVLHPFSEEQGTGPERDFPFFQLSHGQMTYDYQKGEMLIYVKGCLYGEWWFNVTTHATFVARNSSMQWKKIDLGWTLPGKNWIDPEDKYIGHSQLNWMNDEVDVDWWKKNYKNTSTWTWFDRNNDGFPFRIMFSAPPRSNLKGEPDNLAFFQMYSFSFIVNAKPEPIHHSRLHIMDIGKIGLTCGNPDNFQVFNWTNHFSVSAHMIPVDYPHNPYPTKVYYRWNDDEEYTGAPFDRSQSTIFYHDYNRFERMEGIRADLFGHWNSTTKPRPGVGFLLKTAIDSRQTECSQMFAGEMPIAQQPPWWPQLGQANIQAIIRRPENASDEWRSPLTGSDRTVAIIRVTFPSHLPNFPNSTSLWTWYDYTDFIQAKAAARPIVFMQSAPKFELGTSLALADFFDFHVLPDTVHSRTPLDLENLNTFCNITL